LQWAYNKNTNADMLQNRFTQRLISHAMQSWSPGAAVLRLV
jgi:hypothetical protein